MERPLVILLAALAAAVLLIPGEGGPVAEAVPGDWDIYDTVVVEDTTIVMDGNVTVHAGGSLTLDNVTLKMNVQEDGQYHIEVQNSGAMYIENGSVITDGDADNDTLPPESTENHRFVFWVREGATFEMRDSELHESGYEFEDYHTGLHTWADNAVIHNNLISHNFVGILLESDYNTITNNTVSYSDADGIHVWMAHHNELSHNTTLHHNYQGIFMDSSHWNELSFNTASLNSETGIVVFRADNNVLTHNTANDNGVNGIYLERSDSSLVKDNKAAGNGRSGISAGLSSNLTIKDNTMTSNYIGMSLGSKELVNSIICHNTVSDNTYGINLFGQSDSNAICGNSISNSDYGILVLASSNNTFSNNIVSNNDHGFNIVYQWEDSPIPDEREVTGNSENNTLVSNAITSNNVGMRLDDASVNTTITRNTISENTDDGVISMGSSGTTVIDSNIIENGGYGVRNTDVGLTVNAEHNWWGDPSGPGGLGPGTGDEVSDGVDYDNWLYESVDVSYAPCPCEGGGIAEAIVLGSDSPAAETSGSSSARDYTAPIAAAAGVAGVLAIAAGGWYVRRRLP